MRRVTRFNDMTSVFGGLSTDKYDRYYTDKVLVQRIWHYVKPFRSQLFIVFTCLLLVAALYASFPVLVSEGVDEIALSGDQKVLVRLMVFIAVAGVSIWLLSYVRFGMFNKLIGDVVLEMRNDAFKASVFHDLGFYDEHISGKIISRVTSDTHEFGQTMRLIGDILNQMAVVVVLIVVLFRIEWRLACLQLVLSPVLFLLVKGWRKIARRVTRQGARAMANVNSAIQEAITGITIAKNFRQEGYIYGEFDEVNQESYRINFRRGLVLSTVFPVLHGLVGVGVAIMLYAGGRVAGIGLISAGAWYLFVSTVDRFWFPIMQLAAFWSQFQAGLAAAERVFALIDTESAVHQKGNDYDELLSAEIVFQNVRFAYEENQDVLDDFNLRIDTGQSVALVGHTGAGKSSLLKLLSRFYEFQDGSILVDGRDIRSLNLQAYRRQIGIVSQSPFLFSGTLADNIRYASPDSNDNDILYVAHTIGSGEWLSDLPHGIYTDVGERGSKLSLGQRQLVALSRVLLQDPLLFLLDEATASIDPFTESQIQEALDLIMDNRTSILIAHRLSTVQSSDLIIVMNKGRIIESGSHNDLMVLSGHYSDLYNTYFRHQSFEYIEDLN